MSLWSSYMLLITANSVAYLFFLDSESNDELAHHPTIPSNHLIRSVGWSGFPDFDANQVFTGTFQNVLRQMKEIKGSDYTPSFMLEAKDRTIEAWPRTTTKSTIECGDQAASRKSISENIMHLKELPFTVWCTMKLGTCARTSCVRQAAVLLSFDEGVEDNIYACSMPAIFANEITEQCESTKVAGEYCADDFKLWIKVGKAKC